MPVNKGQNVSTYQIEQNTSRQLDKIPVDSRQKTNNKKIREKCQYEPAYYVHPNLQQESR